MSNLESELYAAEEAIEELGQDFLDFLTSSNAHLINQDQRTYDEINHYPEFILENIELYSNKTEDSIIRDIEHDSSELAETWEEADKRIRVMDNTYSDFVRTLHNIQDESDFEITEANRTAAYKPIRDEFNVVPSFDNFREISSRANELNRVYNGIENTVEEISEELLEQNEEVRTPAGLRHQQDPSYVFGYLVEHDVDFVEATELEEQSQRQYLSVLETMFSS